MEVGKGAAEAKQSDNTTSYNKPVDGQQEIWNSAANSYFNSYAAQQQTSKNDKNTYESYGQNKYDDYSGNGGGGNKYGGYQDSYQGQYDDYSGG